MNAPAKNGATVEVVTTPLRMGTQTLFKVTSVETIDRVVSSAIVARAMVYGIRCYPQVLRKTTRS
jgi:hypothetical protein